MNEDTIAEYATEVVLDYLDEEIEFCRVYESDWAEDINQGDLRLIHDKAREILSIIYRAFNNEDLNDIFR